MARPKVHDEALAEVLLEKATRIVGLEGPAALSLRRITQSAGTSTSAIYSLYGSRDALLDAVYERAIESFVASTVVRATDDPLADLMSMGCAYRKWALAHPQMYPVMFGRRHGDSPDGIRERTRHAVEPLRCCVQRCLDAGLFTGGGEEIIVQLWSSVHGFVTLELDGLLAHSLMGDDVDLDAAYETLMRASICYWGN
ncbi:TetR/AcrR family transcriptional regulator [Tessaracoccus sp. MC1865]|uniref:TetR/AcrR family transcriptional regulator n=1 Tax=Tessaracoccus sp. MC1865 TaxID=2760310 RepID=UPI0015FF7B27|nr:TetR/AcrR family transcriptional regulator [Tessaracoccus sp. MC1865]MBB1484843.1 TetR/AcrR family transcriptional regulator [Tessaracoccus sp. MC1865]QTO38755.1 TetR/AcrR family transcriptional regulator [Tessaracoccus sp. MC1865]